MWRGRSKFGSGRPGANGGLKGGVAGVGREEQEEAVQFHSWLQYPLLCPVREVEGLKGDNK